MDMFQFYSHTARVLCLKYTYKQMIDVDEEERD